MKKTISTEVRYAFIDYYFYPVIDSLSPFSVILFSLDKPLLCTLVWM